MAKLGLASGHMQTDDKMDALNFPCILILFIGLILSFHLYLEVYLWLSGRSGHLQHKGSILFNLF